VSPLEIDSGAAQAREGGCRTREPGAPERDSSIPTALAYEPPHERVSDDTDEELVS
jgi:hypothetical protein